MALEASDAKAENPQLFILNIKTGGKLHRLLPQSSRSYHERQSVCGWKASGSVTKALICKTIFPKQLCRKYFQEAESRSMNTERDIDSVEIGMVRVTVL